MTLTEFLLARIGDQEVVARRWLDIGTQVVINPLLVLAQCAAKRRIVRALAAREAPDFESDDARDVGATFAFRQVCLAHAAVYADHPDYDVTWACRLT